MQRYMLDTNIICQLLRLQPHVARHVAELPMSALCISSITEGELLFGLAKRPAAKELRTAVRELLLRVETMPWDGLAAEHYGPARADLVRRGRTLALLDLLIATHALSLGAVLVTNDQAIRQLPELQTEDWSVQ